MAIQREHPLTEKRRRCETWERPQPWPEETTATSAIHAAPSQLPPLPPLLGTQQHREEAKPLTRGYPLSCRHVLALGTTRATQHHRRFYWLHDPPLRDSACGYIQQSPRNLSRLRETSELS